MINEIKEDCKNEANSVINDLVMSGKLIDKDLWEKAKTKITTSWTITTTSSEGSVTQTTTPPAGSLEH